MPKELLPIHFAARLGTSELFSLIYAETIKQLPNNEIPLEELLKIAIKAENSHVISYIMVNFYDKTPIIGPSSQVAYFDETFFMSS